MASVPPPRDPYYGPWYRRYWEYSNRPFSGCGCLYAVVLLLILWWILSLFIPGFTFWGGYF
ncbi:MAG: hypothetical protein R3C14_48075 [Caldilineaceae bacterium]